MKTENTMYRLSLENYAAPQSNPNPFYYIGTMEDIRQWVSAISKNADLCVRYRNLIESFKNYDQNSEITHMVSGRELRLLAPMEKVAYAEVQVNLPSWQYVTCTGAVYPMNAKLAEVSQILLRDGDRLYRCVKANFDRLRVCLQCGGEVALNGSSWGAPEMFVYDEGSYKMRMYVCRQCYKLDEYQDAVEDMGSPKEDDLADVSHDIIGLGMY